MKTLFNHLVSGVRWVVQLLADLRHPDWRARRAVRRETDRRIALWLALPPEEQRRWIHPASPTKPPGWTVEDWLSTRRRKYDA